MEVHGRRLCVVSIPGDRRDEDVADGAAALAGHFDHFICKADDNRRGRGHDEIPEMLKAGLIAKGVSEDAISVVPSEVEAIDAALAVAAQGDLLVIFGDDTARCWKQIIYFNSTENPTTEESAVTPPPTPQEFEDLFDSDQAVIRDERGVRLARDVSEDAD
jgi:cyanophycin synthetase